MITSTVGLEVLAAEGYERTARLCFIIVIAANSRELLIVPVKKHVQ